MRPFALCMPYHNNPGMLAFHYGRIAQLPERIKHAFRVSICDDASDEPAFYPHQGAEFGVDVDIHRITGRHVPWSHRVATNIAVREARAFWYLITDIDHAVPLETWSYLTNPHSHLRTDNVYTFQRRNSDGSHYKPHPDSWLMHISTWNVIRGYDERYRGHYGQNMPFVERVKHHAPIVQLPVPLIRYTRDEIPDASERILTRKSAEARQAIYAMRREFIRNGTFYADTRGTAKYERVKA